MVRKGGRNLWIAVPATLVCLAVVAALGWLAAPMVPVAVAWVGDSLRAGAEARAEAESKPSPVERLAAGEDIDCRDLYPDQLWAELIWHGDVLLSQGALRPEVATEELVDALDPAVVVSCSWAIGRGERITTTLSSVTGDAAGIAQATLTAAGFACATPETGLECARSRGASREEHVLRGDVWLVTVETGWAPEDYGVRLSANIWG